MKNNKTAGSKREYILGIAIVVCIIIIVAVAVDFFDAVPDDESFSAVVSFVIEYDDEANAAHLWSDEENDIHYLFLPSYADLNHVHISSGSSYNIEIDSRSYGNNETLGSCELSKEYAVSLLDEKGDVIDTGAIVFLRSANIPAMFIDTQSGNMAYIHSDKANKEAAEMRLVSQAGVVEFDGMLDRIKGRGNLSWHYEKKSYNITLPEKKDLIGLGKATGWCLISNYSDASNMRNKIVYDFARDVDLAFTPGCEYVDLYLNGEYAGLYLLTEKVEIGENRVDIYDLEEETQRVNNRKLSNYDILETDAYKGYYIDNNPKDIGSGYLLELEFSGKYKDEPSWIITENGQSLAIRSPEYASVQQIEYLASFLGEFEEALYSDTGINAAGKSYLDYIDVASWATKYFIEEVFANQDTEWSSQYFYIAGDEGNFKLYAGPVWDYDYSLGNAYNTAGHNPQTLVALWRGEYDSAYLSWYSELCKKADFYERVTAMYSDRFKPQLDSLLDTGIEEQTDTIADAAVMNGIRWYHAPQTAAARAAINDERDELLDFLFQRVDFLDALWIEKTHFHTVSYDGQYENLYYKYSIPSGQTVGEPPEPQRHDYIFEGWYDSGTDMPFDNMQPITSDTALYAKWTQAHPLESFIKRYFALIIYAIIIGVIIVLLIILGMRKRRRICVKDEIE